LTLLEFQPPDLLTLRVVCSAGAYVRSLAHDLGRALGTYGYLDGLRREAVGPFTLADAHSLPAIAQAGSDGALARYLLAPGTGLPLPSMPAPAELLQRLGFGQIVPMACVDCDPAYVLVQVHDAQGQLAGIIRRLQPAEDDSTVWLWKAEKWLI
jgi:tRNA U55 pseudouridine synthase TruB